MKRDREYLYVVEVRKGKDENGVWKWERREQKATSMVEVSRLLKIKLDDMRYLNKGML